MAIDLSTLSTREALTAVYIGYYSRAADPAGIEFWEDVVADTSLDLEAIATDFSTQDETLAEYPFFEDQSASSPSAFITAVYQNLFERDPDDAGLAFWTNELEAAVAGERSADDPNPDAPVLTVGGIIIAIIEGAQAPDDAIIMNKIEVALDWTATAESVSDFDYTDAAAANAAAVIDGVDQTQASVNEATAATDDFFDPILNPPVAGDDIDLVIGETRVTGTDGDDQINAFPGQNDLGGVANTLSSASNIDGGAGNDRLHADLTDEFTGSNLSGGTDVQPRIKNVEEIDIEARDNDDIGGGVTFDAKNVTDVEVIGSHFSDGDLTIENLTTLTDDGSVRNTGDMTIAMEHTGPTNSNSDASNLTVYFDNDYLVNDAPVSSGASLTIELMDLDAETLGQAPLLDNPFGLITFNFGDELKTLDFGTESNTYAELLADIQGAIALAAQTDADFSQLSVSFGPEFTVQDTDTDPNPAQPDLTGTTILITNTGPEELEAVTMQATGAAPAGKDFHTGFSNDPAQTEEFPISVNIDLLKAGRGGEGGDLVVGGKAAEVAEGIAGGIEVFNVSVQGEGEGAAAGQSKPSNIGTLTSTLGELRVVNIETAEEFRDGDTFASLEIRDGFNAISSIGENGELQTVNAESGDLQTVNANDFLGNLTLGSDESIINLDTLTALGGGDITFNGVLNGAEAGGSALFTGQDYTYLTGGGDDAISLTINGDALDYAGSSVEIKTGAGDDSINVNMDLDVDGIRPSGPTGDVDTNEQLNQAILDNVDIDGGAGGDVINVDGIGNANIKGGTGNDVIYTDGVGTTDQNTAWALNFDNVRVDTQGIRTIPEDELPGVETSWAYLDGATITVTLSGAGDSNAGRGGGVMALLAPGAVQGDDGYEASFTISDLIGGNQYFGDQRDVNAAIKSAIEGDDVLKNLLTVRDGPNNTLVIESLTSGRFVPGDLRIDIDQGNADSDVYAGNVLTEARTLFSDSSLTLSDLWGGTTFSTNAALSYEATAPGANLTTSLTANDWFDGLSVAGETNEAFDNMNNRGFASNFETDNVINGGAGDDLIVLSTDATFATTLDYTPGGNNSMLNGSSNETVVMTGSDFGDDTIMNFSTTGRDDRTATVNQTIATVLVETQGADAVAAAAESFILDVNPVPESGADYTIDFDGAEDLLVAAGDNPMTIAGTIAGGDFTNYTATDNGDGTVTFTANTTGNVPDIGVNNFNAPDVFDESAIITTQDGTAAIPAVAEVFTVSFADAEVAGTIAGFDGGAAVSVAQGDSAIAIATAVAGAASGTTYMATDNGDGTVTYEAVTAGDITPDVTAADFGGFAFSGTATVADSSGLDFLDFTDYLTSLEDTSTNGAGSADSDDSNTPIAVTLDFDLDDVQANEVAVVQHDNIPTADTFAGLSASVIEQLFNSTDAANNYGTLTVSANADDEYNETATTDELVDGAAKAVVMVENADNLGQYKVFELSWNGDASNDANSSLDGAVSVVDLGSLDFGTSLNGLTDVNLVGSDAYAALIDNGLLG